MEENEVLEDGDIDNLSRTVAVIWSADEPMPKVALFTCSAFEAIGMLKVALNHLEAKFAIGDDDDDDDEEDFEEEDD